MTNQNVQKNQLFDLGRTVATPRAIEALQQFGVSAASLLGRHQRGDWGDLEYEDIARNNSALRPSFQTVFVVSNHRDHQDLGNNRGRSSGDDLAAAPRLLTSWSLMIMRSVKKFYYLGQGKKKARH